MYCNANSTILNCSYPGVLAISGTCNCRGALPAGFNWPVVLSLPPAGPSWCGCPLSSCSSSHSTSSSSVHRRRRTLSPATRIAAASLPLTTSTTSSPGPMKPQETAPWYYQPSHTLCALTVSSSHSLPHKVLGNIFWPGVLQTGPDQLCRLRFEHVGGGDHSQVRHPLATGVSGRG